MPSYLEPERSLFGSDMGMRGNNTGADVCRQFASEELERALGVVVGEPGESSQH
jgi:hypothetical protein